MSSRNMNLDVIVRMRDLLSGPLRRLRSSLEGIASFSRKIGILGAAVAGISFLGPIDQAAAFQQKMLDIAGTMELTREAAFNFADQAKTEYEGLALAIGQYSDTVATGAGAMIASGVSKELIDQSIGDIGRAATAANAEFSDMTSVATSLLQTLRVPADQLDDSLGALVTAGKLGSFELKDMAKYFPTLTSQMAKFGVTGREAVNFLGAALQIARKGTSDPAEAANNLKNFLAKILAPATIKNFKDAGVDIEAVMKDAALKGINPIEAVVQKISKLTGMSGKDIDGLMKKAKANGLEGADALGYVREQLEKIYGAGKLGEIFGDMQVMDFLIPMLGNLDEYKRIKEDVAKATGDVIDADFETQMLGLNRQMIIFKEIGVQAIREVGLAFGTWMPQINEHLMAGIKWLRELDKETGGMVRQTLAFAGVALLLVAALGALGVVLPILGAGMSALAMPFIGTGRAAFAISRYFWGAARSAIALQAALAAMEGARFSGLARLAVGLKGVAMAVPGVSTLVGIFSAIGAAVATVTWPIWALIAAIAAVGIAIYNYWEPIKNFVQGFASVIGGAIGELTAGIAEIGAVFAKAHLDFGTNLAKMLGFDDAQIAAVLAKVKGLADQIVGFIKAIPGMVGNFLSDIFTMSDYSAEAEASFRTAGERAGRAMVDAIKAVVDEIISFFSGLGQRILDAIGKIDVSGLISWPSLPAWMGGGGTPANPEAANQGMMPPQGAPPQTLHVLAESTVKVDGPGKVTETNTSVSSPSSNINTGRAVGRR